MKALDFVSVGPASVLSCAALMWILLALGVGCFASGGDSTANPGGAGSGADDQLTLQEACAASCNAQAATRCPGVLAPADCTDSCLELQGLLHCPDAWRDVNACIATAPLSCDPINGGASVSSKDCGPELDAFRNCM